MSEVDRPGAAVSDDQVSRAGGAGQQQAGVIPVIRKSDHPRDSRIDSRIDGRTRR
ncbi:hypothetical protein [Streptomyces sp. SS]|uniref:hypothetical protein n=1 Tax=Streptomyces sp. SS TaxID=260742 RepID=UPI00030213EC|nr:hypothetical protein [Streptomyces sp. SS]